MAAPLPSQASSNSPANAAPCFFRYALRHSQPTSAWPRQYDGRDVLPWAPGRWHRQHGAPLLQPSDELFPVCSSKKLDLDHPWLFGQHAPVHRKHYLRQRFFSAIHHVVDELGNCLASKFWIRQDFSGCYDTSSWHISLTFHFLQGFLEHNVQPYLHLEPGPY
jgi:hypothetical protein